MQIGGDGQTRRGVEGVVRFPGSAEDGCVGARKAEIAGGIPALDGAAVDVRAERKGSVTRWTDAQAVGVGCWVGEGDERGRGG